MQAAGYVPVALSGDDYVELLPACWRAINAYGIKLNHRTYDTAELGPLRRQDSGVAARKHLWEVHHDPYDVTRIWVRNHWGQGWITVLWRHLGSVPVPFGELAWNHARGQLGGQGRDGTPDSDEEAVAAAVAALLEVASRGPAHQHQPGAPASAKDRKVAARTRATSQRTWPAPTPPAPEPAAALEESDQQHDDAPAGKVVPLGVFDPYQEATKRW